MITNPNFDKRKPTHVGALRNFPKQLRFEKTQVDQIKEILLLVFIQVFIWKKTRKVNLPISSKTIYPEDNHSRFLSDVHTPNEAFEEKKMVIQK